MLGVRGAPTMNNYRFLHRNCGAVLYLLQLGPGKNAAVVAPKLSCL